MIKVQVKPTGKQMSHMEQQLLLEAKDKITSGADILFIRLFLSDLIDTWRKRDKYRNASTTIEARGRDIVLKNNDADLVQFIPLV